MRVIAITGSNGKSTVTAMCGDMCRMAGLTTCVAGNIGLPVLDALYEIEQGLAPAPQVWVLELSSFQLETTSSLNADRRHRAQPVGRSHGSLSRHGRLRRRQGADFQR